MGKLRGGRFQFREFLKGTLCIVVIAGFLTSAFAWIDDRPDNMTWALRIGGFVASLAALAAFCMIRDRRDEAPDYLYQLHGGYFDCGGLCFVPRSETVDDVFYLTVDFQNRFERPCSSKFSFYPQKGLLGAGGLLPIHAEVHCGSGALGRIRIPLAVPAMIQGFKQTFDISASCRYPAGRGRQLRFRYAASADFHTPFLGKVRAIIAILSALTPHYHYHKAATVTVELPMNVVDELPRRASIESVTLWTLGDFPLDVLRTESEPKQHI